MLSSARILLLKEFIKLFDIETDNLRLFDEALTHPSYNIEHNKGYDYERLEFLGDSVLRVFAAQYLFERYPDYDEGRLTKIRSCIVSDKFLAQEAYKLEYYKYIELGSGEEKDKGRKKESILACAFEAVLGALYLSAGYSAAKDFVYKIYNDADIEDSAILYNAKEMLQEYTQGLNKDLPEYRLEKETGPAHNKTFYVCVFYHGEKIGAGSGKTKKEAEQDAAGNALNKFNLII